MKAVEIRTPYLVFLGDVANPIDAKTGRGLVDWRPELCIGQLRLEGCGADLGLPDMTPAEARAAGAGSLVIGIASFGGAIEPHWEGALLAALDSGLDIVSGMHTRLDASAALRERAAAAGRRLVDVRRPPAGIPVGSGRKRSGKRLLTVGTDCCVGKKYTALALERELSARNVEATFRATGQTGILIAGGGMPIDAVVSDFLSGAAELLSPDNKAGHWDVIEGQGSLFHPAYAAVTLGLLHGSQPDALVICHDAARTHIEGYPDFPLPSLSECVTRYVESGRLTNPGVRVIGVSLNTSGLSAAGRARRLEEAAKESGVPAVDPVATGVGPLVDALEQM